jgi:hypothetical protein
MSTVRVYLGSLLSPLAVPLRTVKSELNKRRWLQGDTVECKVSRVLDPRKSNGIIQVATGVVLASKCLRDHPQSRGVRREDKLKESGEEIVMRLRQGVEKPVGSGADFCEQSIHARAARPTST